MNDRLTIPSSLGEDGKFCDGCERFGEPNGCNKAGGECGPYLNHQDVYQRLFEIEDILYDASGSEIIAIDTLRDLIAAYMDGRVRVLPYKAGTKFAQPDDPDHMFDLTFTGNIQFEVVGGEESELYSAEDLAHLVSECPVIEAARAGEGAE